MELKDLCLAIVNKMEESKKGTREIVLERSKNKCTMRYVGSSSDVYVHLVVDTKCLTIAGTIKVKRSYDDMFYAKLDIKKKLKIYSHISKVPEFWKPFHDLLNQY